MKLNDLKLPDSVIAGLYSKTLVMPADAVAPEQKISPTQQTAEPAVQPAIKEKIQFLGENRKHILVAVNHANVAFLPEAELSFLTNMLTACQLNIQDTAIINLHTMANPSYKDLFQQFNSNVVLLFGIDPSEISLPVSFPHFQVQAFNNCTFLYTPSLDEIQTDKILKSKLWVCLRRVFNV